MTTTHTQIAENLAVDDKDTAVVATVSARQGDLVLRRTGDVPDKIEGNPVHIQLAAGAHGEHRFIGVAVWISEEARLIVKHGVVVHTDVPDARHGSIRLSPGEWCYHNVRELTTDLIVEDVRD